MEKNTVIGNIEMRNSECEVQNENLKKSALRTPHSALEKGFTILELMIAMFILIILISVALPTYQRSIQHARETVLKENLFQMRRAIDQYTADKGKLPESLDTLVEEKYLREKPVDPISEKAEWDPISGDNINPDDGQGVTDVKSLAEGEDGDGKKFADY